MKYRIKETKDFFADDGINYDVEYKKYFWSKWVRLPCIFFSKQSCEKYIEEKQNKQL